MAPAFTFWLRAAISLVIGRVSAADSARNFAARGAILNAPETLAIDLDGTLIDSAPDLMAALNTVLRQEGLPTVALEQAKGMIGAGARALLERGLAYVGADLPTPEVDKLFDDFFAHYTAHIADESRPYPGVIAAIDRFRADGWRIALCTNKLENLSRLLLKELDILDRFDAVGGGDTFGVKKPNPEHLLRTIQAAGGDPSRAVMVGDSETDIATAKAAGVPVVAVDFGYTTVPVSAFAPDRIISHFDDLYSAVADLRGTPAK